MIEITPRKIKNQTVVVPGSKSYTHRVLIAAALADGVSLISNPLDSQDTRLTRSALEQMGVDISESQGALTIHGTGGRLASSEKEIYLGNSGTSMRLLTAVAALGNGCYTLTGSDRMYQRPIQDLLDGLTQIGVPAHSIENNGCPPIQITGAPIRGGSLSLNCASSSQFLSALLLIGGYTIEGLDITVTQGPVSRPYIDMTVEVMESFGISVKRESFHRFQVSGNQVYRAGRKQVEPDCSQAGYFWAAAALSGAAVKVRAITRASNQGDIGFVDVLAAMGCAVTEESDGIAVKGGPLRAVDVDMAHMPDLVPTLAVVAAFARGTTVIRNVAHLKVKESDRLSAVANELTKMGIDVLLTENGLAITGGQPRGAEIETYDDHRIAMSFAVAGIRAPGVVIRGEHCVEKSFPNFWLVFEGWV